LTGGGNSAAVVDPDLMPSTIPLSAAQEQFSRENGTDAGPAEAATPGWVYFYKRDPAGTRRWLVDGRGGLREATFFRLAG
jgi:hypothetical protein